MLEIGDKVFQAHNTKTGECIEYSHVIESNEIDMFEMAAKHVEAKFGRKVTAHVTTEYYNKLMDDKHTLVGVPVVIDNEQGYELILKC